MTKNPHLRFFFVAMYIAAGYLFFTCLFPATIKLLLPFLLAYGVAAATRPIVRILCDRWKMKERAAAVVAMIAITLLLVGTLAFLLTKIFSELWSLAMDIPRLLNMLPGYINSLSGNLNTLLAALPPRNGEMLRSLIIQSGSALLGVAQDIVQRALGGITNFAASLPGILMFTVAFFLSTIFICLDWDSLHRFIKSQIPRKNLGQVRSIRGYTLLAAARYFKGLFIILLLNIAILLAGLLILGKNYAFILAVVIAFLDILPLIGTGIILVPWAIISLTSGDAVGCVGLLALFITVSLTRQIVEPKIISRSMGLPPLVTVISVYIGLKTFGFAGFILFPVAALVVVFLQNAGIVRLWKKESEG